MTASFSGDGPEANSDFTTGADAKSNVNSDVGRDVDSEVDNNRESKKAGKVNVSAHVHIKETLMQRGHYPQGYSNANAGPPVMSSRGRVITPTYQLTQDVPQSH